MSKIKYSVNVVLEGGRAVTKIKELGNDKAVETQNEVTIANEKESTPPLPTKPRGEEPKDPPTKPEEKPKDPPTKPEVPPTTPSGGTPPATPATEVPPTTPPISGGGGGTPPSIVRPDRPPTGTDIDEYGVPTQGRDRDKTKETEIGESSLPKGGKDRVQKISGAPKTGSREYNIRIMKFFATGSLLLLGMVWIKKGRRYF